MEKRCLRFYGALEKDVCNMAAEDEQDSAITEFDVIFFKNLLEGYLSKYQIMALRFLNKVDGQ